KPGEIARHLQKGTIHDLPDRPQRMVPPHPRLQIHIAEKLTTPVIVAAHRPPSDSIMESESRLLSGRERLFQQPARPGTLCGNQSGAARSRDAVRRIQPRYMEKKMTCWNPHQLQKAWQPVTYRNNITDMKSGLAS